MRQKRSASAAFSLVEVVLALGLAAFALLAIIGLLPVGVSAQQDSARETIAANLATAIVSDLAAVPGQSALRQNPGMSSASPRYKVDADRTDAATEFFVDESGRLLAGQPKGGDYRVEVRLQTPSADRAAVFGTVKIFWPATAEASARSLVLFIALDRN